MTARPHRPIALITGATRGIGLAISRALAPSHHPVLVARDPDALEQVRGVLAAEESCTDAMVCPCDLAEASAVQELIDDLDARGMVPQVLVHNAGVAPSAPLAHTDAQAWEHTLALNLNAPFMMCRAWMPAMARLGWGRVINIASTAALKGYRYTSAYSASKGGLLGLTRALAAEFATKGVTVNAVCPGFTDTRIVGDAVANISAKTGRSSQEARAVLENFSPIGRLIQPQEVAALVAYLASDAAAALTGSALPIDGGEVVL